MTDDSRFPLGKPVNRRAPEADLVPIEGRPHWFRHRRTGAEVYREPAKKPSWPFPTGR